MTKRFNVPIYLLIFIIGLSGCSGKHTNVSLRQDKAFPIPLVKPYPLNVGSFYSQEFIDYTYVVEAKRCNWASRKLICLTRC